MFLLTMFLLQSDSPDVSSFISNLRKFLSKMLQHDQAIVVFAQAATVIIVAYAALMLIQGVTRNLSEQVPRRRRLLIKQSVPLLKGFVIVVAVISLLYLLTTLTEDDPITITVTLFLALGFAFKDYASSIAAGLINLIEGPFRMGDRIQIGEHYGEVTNYGLRGLELQTPDDNAVTIPHNTTWTAPISNANSGQLEAQVVTDFYFAHNADIALATDILYQAAYSSRYTQLKLPVLVIATEQPWATRLQLKSYPMDARNEFVYKTDLVLRIKAACVRERIPYPQMPNPQMPNPQMPNKTKL